MKTRTCLFVLLAGLSCGLLTADTLNYAIAPGTAGESLYQFTLSNSGSTGGPLFDLFLALPTDLGNVETATIGKPALWGDPSGGLLFFGPDADPATSFIEWTADSSGTNDVGVGKALPGFSFTTLKPINGPIRFALNGSTTLDTAVPGVVSNVPEPGTMALLLLAFVALGVTSSVPNTEPTSKSGVTTITY